VEPPNQVGPGMNEFDSFRPARLPDPAPSQRSGPRGPRRAGEGAASLGHAGIVGPGIHTPGRGPVLIVASTADVIVTGMPTIGRVRSAR